MSARVYGGRLLEIQERAQRVAEESEARYRQHGGLCIPWSLRDDAVLCLDDVPWTVNRIIEHERVKPSDAEVEAIRKRADMSVIDIGSVQLRADVLTLLRRLDDARTVAVPGPGDRTVGDLLDRIALLEKQAQEGEIKAGQHR